MKYKFKYNPVINFYDNIMPTDFTFSSKVNKQTIDLICICEK